MVAIGAPGDLAGLPLAPVAVAALLAEFGGEQVSGGALAGVMIDRLAPPDRGSAGAIVALGTPRSLRALLASGDPTLLLLTPAMRIAFEKVHCAPKTLTLWEHPHAPYVFARLLERVQLVLPPPQVDAHAQLEPGVVLLPGVTVGPYARIGANSVLGRAGFGFVPDPAGRPYPLRHWGGVTVGAYATIGAGCTIDAGLFAPTTLGAHVHLDSQVHVGHNVEIGEGSVVAAQSGFGGSVRVGRGVEIGGQVGIADHVTVGDFARIAAKSGVIADVPARAVVAGYPAVDRATFFRAAARSYARTTHAKKIARGGAP